MNETLKDRLLASAQAAREALIEHGHVRLAEDIGGLVTSNPDNIGKKQQLVR